MEENKESFLERVVSFAKECLEMPWIHSSSEQDYSLPETRNRIYGEMNRY